MPVGEPFERRLEYDLPSDHPDPEGYIEKYWADALIDPDQLRSVVQSAIREAGAEGMDPLVVVQDMQELKDHFQLNESDPRVKMLLDMLESELLSGRLAEELSEL